MTLVVATNNGMCLHGDRRVLEGSTVLEGSPKVRKCKGPFLLGAAGDGAACSRLVHTELLPRPTRVLDLSGWGSWIMDVLLPEIRQGFSEDNYSGDVTLLLGTKQGIFYCSSLYECEHIQQPFWAIGAGAPYALGILETVRRVQPKDLFPIVARYESSVGATYSTVTLERRRSR